MKRLYIIATVALAALLTGCANYVPPPQYQDYYVGSQYKSQQMSLSLATRMCEEEARTAGRRKKMEIEERNSKSVTETTCRRDSAGVIRCSEETRKLSTGDGLISGFVAGMEAARTESLAFEVCMNNAGYEKRRRCISNCQPTASEPYSSGAAATKPALHSKAKRKTPKSVANTHRPEDGSERGRNPTERRIKLAGEREQATKAEIARSMRWSVDGPLSRDIVRSALAKRGECMSFQTKTIEKDILVKCWKWVGRYEAFYYMVRFDGSKDSAITNETGMGQWATDS